MSACVAGAAVDAVGLSALADAVPSADLARRPALDVADLGVDVREVVPSLATVVDRCDGAVVAVLAAEEGIGPDEASCVAGVVTSDAGGQYVADAVLGPVDGPAAETLATAVDSCASPAVGGADAATGP